MVKRSLTLNVDDDLIQLAKSKQINISNLVNSILEAELTHENLFDIESKDELIFKLKGRIAVLSSELQSFTEKYKEIEQNIEKIKEQNIKEIATLKEKHLIEIKKLKDKYDSGELGGRVTYQNF
jgi:archaellum component FlaC